MGLGFAAVSGARAARAGADAAQVADIIERRATASSVYFYVDTLEYLRRGGRVSAARAAVGQALQVKPLLHVVDGHVTRLEQVRTAGKALARLEDLAVAAADGHDVDIAVQHLASPDRAAALAARLRERLPAAEVVEGVVGGVVGAHVGPGHGRRRRRSARRRVARRREAVTDLPTPVWWLIAAVVGYALGAINPAAIVARVFGVDLRSTGSGNPGATNVGRALGPRWAVLVGVLDVLKGFIPAVLFGTFVGQTSGEIAGLAAVVGHITSPLLKGRGGKGVATTLGAILGVQPLLAVPVLLAFGIGVAVWHRVGLGAVLGAVALIVSGLVGWAAGWLDEADMWFAVVLGMLVLVRHQRNLREAWASFRSAD